MLRAAKQGGKKKSTVVYGFHACVHKVVLLVFNPVSGQNQLVQERWRKNYNEIHPHNALTYLTSVEVARKSGSEAV